MTFAPTMDAIADRIEAEYMPYPLDADGLPCKIGDHVKSDETCGNIKEMLLFERGGKRWEIYLTTLDDAMAASTKFEKVFGCGMSCDECPAKINGKTPKEYYGTDYCCQSVTQHILRLERERVAGEQK